MRAYRFRACEEQRRLIDLLEAVRRAHHHLETACDGEALPCPEAKP